MPHHDLRSCCAFRPSHGACCAVQAYDSELLARVEQGLLQWLCRQVESDLRLHLHAAQEPGLSLNSASSALRSLLPLLRLAPIRLNTRVLHIRWAPSLLLDDILCFYRGILSPITDAPRQRSGTLLDVSPYHYTTWEKAYHLSPVAPP